MTASFVEAIARLNHDPFSLRVDLQFIGATEEYVDLWGVLLESSQRPSCDYGYAADRCKHVFCWT